MSNSCLVPAELFLCSAYHITTCSFSFLSYLLIINFSEVFAFEKFISRARERTRLITRVCFQQTRTKEVRRNFSRTSFAPNYTARMPCRSFANRLRIFAKQKCGSERCKDVPRTNTARIYSLICSMPWLKIVVTWPSARE